MLRFLRSHLTSPEKAASDDLSDFVDFSKTVSHGFLNNTTSIAHDSELSLLAVGSRTGEIIIHGTDNIIWQCVLPTRVHIAHMYFATGSGILIVLGNDQTFHRIRIDGPDVDIKSADPEQRLKRITSCTMYVPQDKSQTALLIGTVTGNIYSLDIEDLNWSECILFERDFSTRIPDTGPESKAVSGMSVSNVYSKKLAFLVDHSVVIYDMTLREVMDSWNLELNPTNIEWSSNGRTLVISFGDGSYAHFNENGVALDQPGIIFGPFPCMPVHKSLVANNDGVPIFLFSGGMPRASYGDRYTITAKRDGRVVCWDFASPVLDFVLITELRDNQGNHTTGCCILVLTDNEIVCIDLNDKDWREVPLGCLYPLHCSQLTTLCHTSNVDANTWKQILKASESFWSESSYSKCGWPISGGSGMTLPNFCAADDSEKRQLLLSGHANGTVRLWLAGQVSMSLLLVINTAREFEGFAEVEEKLCVIEELYDTDTDSEGVVTDEWPPFKKVGEYDPFCDDVRLSVQKLAIDSTTGTIAAGGRGGHIIIYQLSEQAETCDPPSIFDVKLVTQTELLPTHLKNQKGMEPRKKAIRYLTGYQPRPSEDSPASTILLLSPGVAITSVALLAKRNLIAAANEFGYTLFEYKTSQVILKNSLLTHNEIAEAGALDDAISRFKSMKKSIRQSFRRKKKVDSGNTTVNTITDPNCSRVVECEEEEILKPVERRIEARDTLRADATAAESPAWMIRILKFLPNPLVATATPGDSLWVGTNGGRVYMYSINNGVLPSEVCRLEKEIRLQHGAPLLGIEIVPDALKMGSPCKLMLITEEQVRAYTLPHLKATRYKLKLTALEGTRIRKSAIVTLQNNQDRSLRDNFLCLLTNLGELSVYSLQNMRKRVRHSAIKSTDMVGMSSALICSTGEIFWLRPGGSQLQRAVVNQQTSSWKPKLDGFPPKIEDHDG